MAIQHILEYLMSATGDKIMLAIYDDALNRQI